MRRRGEDGRDGMGWDGMGWEGEEREGGVPVTNTQ
jgi:hypothetical protein